MVVLTLSLKAELVNVAKLRLPDDHIYCIKVKESSGSEERDRVRVTAAETFDIPNSRGTANFLLKWSRDARHPATLSVTQLKGVTRPYSATDSGSWVPIVAFECRGIEPVEFYPEDGFVVETTSGQQFDDVDLSEREWVEWDEKLKENVEIMELQWRYDVHK